MWKNNFRLNDRYSHCCGGAADSSTGEPSVRSEVREAVVALREQTAVEPGILHFQNGLLDIPMGLLFHHGRTLRLSTLERCYVSSIIAGTPAS